MAAEPSYPDSEERPRGAQPVRASREEAVGADRVPRRGGDVAAVVLLEVELAPHALARPLEALDREALGAATGRGRDAIPAQGRERPAELRVELRLVVRRANQGDAAEQVP